MPFNVGPMEAVVMLLMMATFVVVLVLVVRALSMSTKRVCPVCGSSVKAGRTTCARCEHDFAAAHRS
jgi:predicted amidophosphoribosyltransferase